MTLRPMDRPVSERRGDVFHPALPQGDPWVDQATSGLDWFRLVGRLAKNPIAVMGTSVTTEPFAHARIGKRDFVYLCSPDLIREAFVDKRDHLRFNPVRQSILKPIIRDGLIAAEGVPWKRARFAATPLFTPRAVAKFADSMRDTAREWCVDAEVGEVSLDAWMSELTYAVLRKALFSGTLSDRDGEVTRAVTDVLASMGLPDVADLLRLPGWVPRLSKRRGKAAVARFRGFVRDAIAERREGDAGNDLLGLLLQASAEDGTGLSDTELEDNIVSFVGAGHETTARWLVWWLYLLSQDNRVRARVVAEADALDVESDPARWRGAMPYLFASLEEALRLYPSAPFLSRSVDKRVELGGMDLEEGSDVVVNIMGLHRHVDLWDDPGAFRPERFLGAARESIPQFAYLPFGTGHRVCVGQRFAVQEAVILGAILLRSFAFEYVGEADPWPVMRVTISADNGMPMRVVRR